MGLREKKAFLVCLLRQNKHFLV